MKSQLTAEQVQQVIAFHGHVCPGLTRGMRVAEIALRELGPRAPDEEFVALAETDNCAVDAIQFLTGCTLGKGNLLMRDFGKNTFVFARRSDGRAVRITRKLSEAPRDPEEEALRERVQAGTASLEERERYGRLFRARALAVLDQDEEDLFNVERLEDFALPDPAQVLPSLRCEACGQLTMASRLYELEGRRLCIPDLLEVLKGRVIMKPIGIIHNELVPHVAPSRAVSKHSTITVLAEYAAGLLGIEQHPYLEVIYYLNQAPTDAPLQQHRRRDEREPLRGVFALRSPHRPNPLGLSRVKLLSVEQNILTVSGLDAWDGTPVLDIKPYEGPEPVEEKAETAADASLPA